MKWCQILPYCIDMIYEHSTPVIKSLYETLADILKNPYRYGFFASKNLFSSCSVTCHTHSILN